MKKLYLLFAFYSIVHGWDYEDYLKQQQTNENIYNTQVEKNYVTYTNQVKANIEKYEKIISKKWSKAEFSTQKKSVIYSDDFNIKESMDFEKGSYKVEIISKEKPTAKEFDAVLAKTRKDSLKDRVKNDPLLDGIKSDDNTKYYKEIIPKKSIKTSDIKVSHSEDKVIYYIDVPFVTDYYKKLASIYEKDIDKYSKKYNIQKEYILGIIQTESNFNPKAVSHIPAYGLMQIVPSSGGLDAYEYITGKKRLLPKYYLVNPTKNIELGCAYINKIQTVYLKGIKDKKSLYYATSTSYNAGIGSLYNSFGRTKKSAVNSINKMDREELYKHLRDREYFLQEAVGYVEKVRVHSAMWQKELNR